MLHYKCPIQHPDCRLVSSCKFAFQHNLPFCAGYENGTITDCSIRHLEHKIQSLSALSSGQQATAAPHVDTPAVRESDDPSFAPVVRRRPADPHLGHSIVSLCIPALSPAPDVLISCSREQQNIVVWSSPTDYVMYRAHVGGARCVFDRMPLFFVC